MTKKAPEIRFKGFEDDWEQRKVSSMSKETFGGGTPKTGVEEYWNGDFPWIQSSDLKFDDLNNISPTKFITQEAINNSATKAIPANSIAIVTRVGVGKLAFMPYPYSTSQDFLSFSSLNVDSLFGLYSLYKLLKKEINNIQGTSIKGITKSDLLGKNINIPVDVNEQAKIGKLMKWLDNTIALHQRKLKQLELLKRALLQKLFPKTGQIIPELRFRGFNESWKHKYLRDYLSIPEKNKIQILDSKQLMTLKLNLGGLESGSKRETLELGSTSYYERKSGQFIYGKQNFFNGSMAIITPEFEGKATSGDVPALDISNINKDFLFKYVSRNSYWEHKEAFASGTGSKRIHEATLLSFEIHVPIESEQENVAFFFKKVDYIVRLYKTKLETLGKIKESLLQKMFV